METPSGRSMARGRFRSEHRVFSPSALFSALRRNISRTERQEEQEEFEEDLPAAKRGIVANTDRVPSFFFARSQPTCGLETSYGWHPNLPRASPTLPTHSRPGPTAS